MGSLSVSEILTILVVILIIFGPRRLPEMARKAGEWTARASRAARELQDAFRDEYREETKVLDDLRRDVDGIRRDLRDRPASPSPPPSPPPASGPDPDEPA